MVVTRRKPGARSHFKRRKNEFGLRTQENKQTQRKESKDKQNTTSTCLGDKTNSSLVPVHFSSGFPMKPSLNSVNLSPHWQVFSNLDDVQYSKLQLNESGVMEVQSTVIVRSDLTWNVYVKGKVVPVSCQVIP